MGTKMLSTEKPGRVLPSISDSTDLSLYLHFPVSGSLARVGGDGDLGEVDRLGHPFLDQVELAQEARDGRRLIQPQRTQQLLGDGLGYDPPLPELQQGRRRRARGRRRRGEEGGGFLEGRQERLGPLRRERDQLGPGVLERTPHQHVGGLLLHSHLLFHPGAGGRPRPAGSCWAAAAGCARSGGLGGGARVGGHVGGIRGLLGRRGGPDGGRTDGQGGLVG
mmetsp:Transcript_61871/g.140052  ORF Transcript_61871/g.140052 Transcript_61871/m.140052 type:complete len:221 (+) Transcript_61871:171-833(+)